MHNCWPLMSDVLTLWPGQDAACLGALLETCRRCPGRHWADETSQVVCCSFPRPVLQGLGLRLGLQAGKMAYVQLQWELLPSWPLPPPI